jgi:hypothetical protein
MKGKLVLISGFSVFVCISCGLAVERFGERKDVKQAAPKINAYVMPTDPGEAGSPGITSPPAISGAPATAGQQALLEKGNFRTAGIPGFGENALPAIAGEYRISGEPEGRIRVWLSRELLYYDGWEARISAPAAGVLQKKTGEGLLIAEPLDDTWTAVFLLAGPVNLSPEDIDRVITACRTRFLYFEDLSNRSSDISLPAAVYY